MSNNNWLPWAQLMAFGFGQLHLTPKEFWSMSLREIDAAIEGHMGKSTKVLTPQRDTFEKLMSEHPDTIMENKHE